MKTHLRLYREPMPETFNDDAPADPAVRVKLRDLLPLVAMAQKLNFVWLKDFLDDDVSVTADLHDVLQSFRGARPSA